MIHIFRCRNRVFYIYSLSFFQPSAPLEKSLNSCVAKAAAGFLFAGVETTHICSEKRESAQKQSEPGWCFQH